MWIILNQGRIKIKISFISAHFPLKYWWTLDIHSLCSTGKCIFLAVDFGIHRRETEIFKHNYVLSHEAVNPHSEQWVKFWKKPLHNWSFTSPIQIMHDLHQAHGDKAWLFFPTQCPSPSAGHRATSRKGMNASHWCAKSHFPSFRRICIKCCYLLGWFAVAVEVADVIYWAYAYIFTLYFLLAIRL